jgi:hypothetical protein
MPSFFCVVLSCVGGGFCDGPSQRPVNLNQIVEKDSKFQKLILYRESPAGVIR